MYVYGSPGAYVDSALADKGSDTESSAITAIAIRRVTEVQVESDITRRYRKAALFPLESCRTLWIDAPHLLNALASHTGKSFN